MCFKAEFDTLADASNNPVFNSELKQRVHKTTYIFFGGVMIYPFNYRIINVMCAE